jgi:hypothetical protein
VARCVDLSAPIELSPPELPDLLRTDIEYSGHAEGAKTIEGARRGPELLRDGEGSAPARRWRASSPSWTTERQVAAMTRTDPRAVFW